MYEKSQPPPSPQDKLVRKNVIFALLPDTNAHTIEEISIKTGYPTEVVSEVLSHLEQLGNITVAGSLFTLTENARRSASMLQASERNIARLEKFAKYRNNPQHSAHIESGIKFDPEQVEAAAGAFQFTRTMSPHEQAYCFEHKVYFVWQEGPRIGEVFLTIDKINETEIETTSPDEFLETIISYLLKLAQKSSDEELIRLHRYVLTTCYGNVSVMGWEKARFYDLLGHGEQINELMVQMLNKSLDEFLQELAQEKGIDIPLYRFNFQDRGVYSLYYDGREPTEEKMNVWDPTKGEIMLTHGTYSHILPNLIQMRGLASRNYYQSLGIKKYYGGESQGSSSYTPNDISFSFHENGQPIIHGGYGSQRAYDFPMSVAIAKDKAEQLSLTLGSMDLQEELVVRDYVPIEFITHIFVPSFKIDDVKEMFRQNQITNVQVLPLRQ
jgi:hypothetical protein